jgi:hypothetical protein
VKDDDLVVGTHGRGFWILDDVTPLRQITADIARANAYLFRPGAAWRFRWNKNTDTPPPPDEPAAPNPPDGVVISYLLGPNVQGPVTLEILENTTGQLIRRYSSDDVEDPPIPTRNIPDYWIRPWRPLAATPGLHRFVWDVRYPPPVVDIFEYPIAAVAHNTPKAPRGMWVPPATYQVRLTVGGRAYRQAVAVKMDPRVKISAADLALQFRLSKALDDMMRQLAAARAEVKQRAVAATGDQATRLRAIAISLDQAYEPMPGLFSTIQVVDARPTAATEAAANDALRKAEAALAAARDAG